MEGSAQYFIDAGTKYDVDPLFLLAIGYHESKYAKTYSVETNNERHNYAGIMTYDNGVRRLRRYKNWEEAVYDHARNIRQMYLDRGLDTIKKIWYVYAPPLEITNDSWGPSVANTYTKFLNKFQGGI